MKYIIFQVNRSTIKQLVPVVFPNWMVHKLVFAFMKDMLIKYHNVKDEDIALHSAGDIAYTTNSITCSGSSETLKIASKGKADAEIIEMYNYLQGIE